MLSGDDVRWVLPAMVVLSHAAVTCVDIGDLWQYREVKELDIASGFIPGAPRSFGLGVPRLWRLHVSNRMA